MLTRFEQEYVRRVEAMEDVQNAMDDLMAAVGAQAIDRAQESLLCAVMDARAAGVSDAWLSRFTRYV